MQSADDVELSHSLAVTGGSGLESLFERHGVGAGCVLLAPESTQPASRHAHIGRIDVPVDIEICLVAVHALAHVISQPTHSQDVPGTIQCERVVGTEALA